MLVGGRLLGSVSLQGYLQDYNCMNETELKCSFCVRTLCFYFRSNIFIYTHVLSSCWYLTHLKKITGCVALSSWCWCSPPAPPSETNLMSSTTLTDVFHWCLLHLLHPLSAVAHSLILNTVWKDSHWTVPNMYHTVCSGAGVKGRTGEAEVTADRYQRGKTQENYNGKEVKCSRIQEETANFREVPNKRAEQVHQEEIPWNQFQGQSCRCCSVSKSDFNEQVRDT